LLLIENREDEPAPIGCLLQVELFDENDSVMICDRPSSGETAEAATRKRPVGPGPRTRGDESMSTTTSTCFWFDNRIARRKARSAL